MIGESAPNNPPTSLRKSRKVYMTIKYTFLSRDISKVMMFYMLVAAVEAMRLSEVLVLNPSN